jgi:hypothetical protein
MEGFGKALKSFEDLTAATDTRREFETDEIIPSLAFCQYLAYWNGQPERFKELTARMKTRQELLKQFAAPDGLTRFVQSIGRSGTWQSNEFTENRRKFFSAVFSKPSLGALFPPNNNWTNQIGMQKAAGIFMGFTSPMPAGFIPEVRAQLMDFRGDQLLAKQPQDAVAAYRTALTECQPGPERNELRAMITYDLAQALFNSKQVEEAKTVYASIPPAEVAKTLKDKYTRLGKSLAAPAQPKK